MENVPQYQIVNKAGRFRIGLMHPFIASAIPKHANTLLDLGCGSADYHSFILKENPHLKKIVGVDSSEQMLKDAIKTEKIQYFCFDVSSQSLEEKFDLITSVFLIEHFKKIETMEAFIENCKLQLNHQGQIQIFSIDSNALLKSPAYNHSIKYVIFSEGDLKDGEQFKIKVGNWENEDTHWSPSFLRNIFQKKGFKTEVKYLQKDIISSQFYTEEEKQQIYEARCVYVLIAKQQ